VANAGKGSAPRAELVPAQPAQGNLNLEDIRRLGPSLEAHPLPAQVGLPGCPGDVQNVQNIHVRLGPPPDYYAEGKAMGMTDDQARTHAAEVAAAQQQMLNQALATIPPPPCP
jgi:hypothetical protein